MKTQRADIRIVANWKSPEQTIAVVDDNWSRENLVLETDKLAYEETCFAIDEHVHGLDIFIEL